LAACDKEESVNSMSMDSSMFFMKTLLYVSVL